MARKKFVPKEPKYKSFTISAEVLNVERINYPNGKLKQVFECTSETGTPRQCVYWQYTEHYAHFEVGDIVILTGYLKNGIFLVWTLKFIKKSTGVENERTG